MRYIGKVEPTTVNYILRASMDARKNTDVLFEHNICGQYSSYTKPCYIELMLSAYKELLYHCLNGNANEMKGESLCCFTSNFILFEVEPHNIKVNDTFIGFYRTPH